MRKNLVKGPDTLVLSYSLLGEKNHNRHPIILGYDDEKSQIICGYVNRIDRTKDEGDLTIFGRLHPDLMLFTYKYNQITQSGSIEFESE